MLSWQKPNSKLNISEGSIYTICEALKKRARHLLNRVIHLTNLKVVQNFFNRCVDISIGICTKLKNKKPPMAVGDQIKIFAYQEAI